MVSERGIEANPEKIKAILNMNPPKSVKGIQEFTGHLAALNRFISRSADKGLPFFKMLRSGKGFRWTEECQQAFDELKVHLTSLSLLVKPNKGDTLLIYLAIFAEAVSAVLVSEIGRAHKPVYYISRNLHGAELRYTKIEKLALALVTVARKLRPYFQSHPIIVLTNHPLKQIVSSPEASRRMVKWAVELSQYGIEYRSRPAIKAQILADFLIKMTVSQEESSTQTWMVYVDGSSTSTGSGAGIVVKSPQGDKFQYAIKFLFPATNNEAEYEAFIMGIKLALSVGVKRLTIHSDSQLIVSQVNGNYEAKEDKMLEYLTQVNELISGLDSYDIKQIPRVKNQSADRLAKLASSLANIDNRKITFLTYVKEKTDGSDVTIFCADSEEPSWKDEIIDYLMQGNLPANQVEARKLRVRAAWFTIIDGELYKRGFSSPYLKCLTPAKGNYVLHEIHEGTCGNYLAGRALAGKALCQGYF
ncbi:uncharacterized protein [Henckelia pumila]|uniref:uncharacterized protein n=1 Tax=Henckelia pumila TaxID=405737 RepID=UPI003C6E7CA2